MSEWKEEHKAKAEEATKVLVNLTNAYGSEKAVAEGIVEALTKEHNTLQQSFWRAMQMVIKAYSEEKYVDLRNEASRDYCKAAAKLADDHHLPLI